MQKFPHNCLLNKIFSLSYCFTSHFSLSENQKLPLLADLERGNNFDKHLNLCCCKEETLLPDLLLGVDDWIRNPWYSGGASKPWFRIWSDIHICLFYEDMRVSSAQQWRVISIRDLWPFLFSLRQINIQECERGEDWDLGEMSLALPVLTGSGDQGASPQLRFVRHLYCVYTNCL